MKKLFAVRIMMFVALAGIVAFTQTPLFAQNTKEGENAVTAKKILVVYYSYSGNTREIAQLIQKETGGDIFEITAIESYPKEYNPMIKQAKEEIAAGYKPKLKSKINNINDYDTIFVGTPNWWSTIAPAVTAFLTEYDLSGKTVIPFCTHGGGGMAKCAKDIAKLTPKATVLEGAAFSGYDVKNAQASVTQWLQKIKTGK